MDENKNGEVLSEDTELEKVDEATSVEEAMPEEAVAEDQAGNDGLEKELEEIRDMFQQELDKATQEAENQEEAEAHGEALIQELDEIDEAADEDAEPKRLCECCGEKPCDEEYGEDYPYCAECRELMKRYPLRWSGVLMTLIMIAVFIGTAIIGTSYAENVMAVSESVVYYESGKLMTALNGYYGYLASADPKTVSMRAVKDAIEGYLNTGYISDAAALVETVFTENQLKLPWYKKYANISEKAEQLTDTYYTVAELVTPVLNGEKYDYDEVMAKLDELYNSTDEEGNPIEYNPVFIEYYRFVVMSVAEKSPEELLAQLKKTAESDEGGFEWVYLSNYAALAAKCGDLELTESLADKMLKMSKEDTNAYLALASYYRYAETPDPAKMLEICEEAKANAAQGDVSYMPYMAIAYLLQGEGAVALETMDTYMSQSGYTVQTCNLYALCALYNGDNDTYKEMKNVLETSGYEISEVVEQYKDGKIEIEDILTDKEGEI